MPNCWYLGIQVHYIEYCMQHQRCFIDNQVWRPPKRNLPTSIFSIKGRLHGQYFAFTLDIWDNLTRWWYHRSDSRYQDTIISSMPNCWYLWIQAHYIEYCMQYWRCVIDNHFWRPRNRSLPTLIFNIKGPLHGQYFAFTFDPWYHSSFYDIIAKLWYHSC